MTKTVVHFIQINQSLGSTRLLIHCEVADPKGFLISKGDYADCNSN